MTPLRIPDDWTAGEALAVYEFIDALREGLWRRYGIEIQEHLKAERSTNPADWGDFNGETLREDKEESF